MFNEQHKKERPILGLLGMGGGIARGGGAAPVPISSSGGNTSAGVAPGNGYHYHVWAHPNSSNFTMSGGSAGQSITVEVLVVGGGGRGHSWVAGGGGAGGVRKCQWTVNGPFDSVSVPVTIGQGGTVGPPNAFPSTAPGSFTRFGPDPFIPSPASFGPNGNACRTEGGGSGGGNTGPYQSTPGFDGGSGGGGGGDQNPTTPGGTGNKVSKGTVDPPMLLLIKVTMAEVAPEMEITLVVAVVALAVLVLMAHLTLVDLVEMEKQFQNLQHLLFHQLFQLIYQHWLDTSSWTNWFIRRRRRRR